MRNFVVKPLFSRKTRRSRKLVLKMISCYFLQLSFFRNFCANEISRPSRILSMWIKKCLEQEIWMLGLKFFVLSFSSEIYFFDFFDNKYHESNVCLRNNIKIGLYYLKVNSLTILRKSQNDAIIRGKYVSLIQIRFLWLFQKIRRALYRSETSGTGRSRQAYFN